MSTINSNAGISGSSGGASSASLTAGITKQIINLQNQLKSLADDQTLTKEDKVKQQVMIENQITMLMAQLAQIQLMAEQQAMDKQQESEEANVGSSKKADGVNRPTDTNSLDVYI